MRNIFCTKVFRTNIPACLVQIALPPPPLSVHDKDSIGKYVSVLLFKGTLEGMPVWLKRHMKEPLLVKGAYKRMAVG